VRERERESERERERERETSESKTVREREIARCRHTTMSAGDVRAERVAAK